MESTLRGLYKYTKDNRGNYYIDSDEHLEVGLIFYNKGNITIISKHDTTLNSLRIRNDRCGFYIDWKNDMLLCMVGIKNIELFAKLFATVSLEKIKQAIVYEYNNLPNLDLDTITLDDIQNMNRLFTEVTPYLLLDQILNHYNIQEKEVEQIFQLTEDGYAWTVDYFTRRVVYQGINLETLEDSDRKLKLYKRLLREIRELVRIWEKAGVK